MGAPLRILTLSNLYPPHHLGGYELGCRDVVEGLRDRGHEVAVLTSRLGGAAREEGHLLRWLTYDPAAGAGSWGALLRREAHDAARLRRAVRGFRPALLFVFSLYGLPHGLLAAAQRTGLPVAYAFSGEWLEPDGRGDPWLSRWGSPAGTGLRGRLKRGVGRLLHGCLPTRLGSLELGRAFFTSRDLRARFAARGFPVAENPVIHWGVDADRFQGQGRREEPEGLRLLFAGRIVEEKGLHTAVEALGRLARTGAAGRIRLDVAGPVQDAAYLRRVEGAAAGMGLAEAVRFLGVVPWEAMPGLYRAHDAYLLPSIWPEPFSIGLLEAMASGLVAVGTPTGGTPELLEDGVNGLAFPPGDASALAAQLTRLLDPALRARLGAAGQAAVRSRFSLAGMLDRIEAWLAGSIGPRGEPGGRRRGP